ncbi:MAG: tetratricopeptide repeat protein [Spirochaetes bacterium]|nr:tetratricopeptide repeat protein [Spirochaetota bacterium]
MKIYIAIFTTLLTLGVFAGAGYLAYTNTGLNQDRSYYRGIKEYEIGHFQESINYFNEFLSLNRNNKKSQDSKFRIALALKLMGDTENAKRKLVEIINERYGDDEIARAVIEYADICRMANMYDYYIIGQIELMLKKFPAGSANENNLNTQFGYQQFFLKQYDAALHHFMNSSTDLAMLGKARVYQQMGEFDKALAVYEEFLTYKRGTPYYQETRNSYKLMTFREGMAQYKKKQYTQALAYFDRIQKFFANTDDAEQALYFAGESCYEMEQYEPALKYYAAVIDNDVELRDAEALLKVGLCYYWLKNYPASFNAMDKFLREYPSSAFAARAQKWKEMAKKEIEYMGGAAKE